ncbi:MAG TPA: ATP-binding protein [Streptosporangiaceae bacterium]
MKGQASELMGDGAREPADQASEVILTATADGVLAIDENGLVRYCNPAAEELLGQPAGSLTGRRFADLAGLTPGLPSELELNLSGGTDRVLDLRVSTAALNGHQLRIAAMRDITYRRQSERSLEAALERQSAALAVAGHELRSPLAAIGVLAHVLADDQIALGPADRAAVATRVAEHAGRLQLLVSRLLTSAQIDAETARPAGSPVGLATVIGEQLHAAARPGAHEVTVSCPDDLTVLADRDDLATMVANYVDNALTYARPPVAITASAADGAAVIEVCDNGPGVPDSYVPRLFERFSRAPDAGLCGEGVGLGLWIVRTLARANNGEAWYERGPGGGSRFCLRLPLADPALADPAVADPGMTG